MASQLNFDCTPKCSSRKHIYQLISAITKTSEPIIINFISRCYNAAKSTDAFGRTLLHVAASCGNKIVFDWLMRQQNIRISTKDLESGWTALHRAFFHGQLDIALHLIQNGSDINIKDREFLTPFELILKDRPKHIDFINTGLNDVYGWGANVNSTLGFESMQSTKIPEQVDFFRREKISINMVSMNMFHTIFLSATGQVYVCGHGQDGRLGLSSEKTILSPTLVNIPAHERCVQISASLNQSYFLMESGSIYSCGLNTYNQLLHHQCEEKSLTPKLMNLKNLKIIKIEKIFGQKFHTIILADNNLYTWGLNAGQIGHGKLGNSAIIATPRLVNQIIKGITITHFATGDYVTSIVTSKGDLYVMQDYLCKKVIHRLLGISQICVTGGKLDPALDPDKGKHSSPITLIALTNLGKMLVWNSDENLIRHIHWNQQRPMKILNFCLSFNWIVVLTTEGDCFTCVLPTDCCVRPFNVCAPVKDMVIDFHGKSLSDLVSEIEFLNLTLQKIPTIYRGNYVACDPKGSNVIILQASPNANLISVPMESTSVFQEELKELLLQSNEFDSTYDVILKFNVESFYCHKFILSQKSNFFQNLFKRKDLSQPILEENMEEKDNDIFKLISNDSATEGNNFEIVQQVETYQINCKNIPTIIFKQFLLYLYTGICDFINPGIYLINYCTIKKEDKLHQTTEIKSKKKKVPTATLR